MEVIEIIFIALGVLLLIASCFMKQKENTSIEIDYDGLVQRLGKRELSQEEIEEIRRVIARIVAERREKIIEETDDYLSKVANEKIFSGDFLSCLLFYFSFLNSFKEIKMEKVLFIQCE